MNKTLLIVAVVAAMVIIGGCASQQTTQQSTLKSSEEVSRAVTNMSVDVDEMTSALEDIGRALGGI